MSVEATTLKCGTNLARRTRFGCGDLYKLKKSKIVLRNCHLHHFGRSGVDVFGCGVTIDHCTFHDCTDLAISINGPENTVSGNEIHSVCLDCGEEGAIYSWGYLTNAGNCIVGNYIHDIYNPEWMRNRGIMLDAGTAGFNVMSNVFERVAEGMVLSNIGNRIEDNVFISCIPPIGLYNTPPLAKIKKDILERFRMTPVHKEPWASRYPYLLRIKESLEAGKPRDSSTLTTIKRNCTTEKYLMERRRRSRFDANTWDTFGNVRNLPLSKAERLSKGIKDQAGCHASPLRASWPISHPVTIKCNKLTYFADPSKDSQRGIPVE